jgi:CRISPR-associated protein Csd1
MSIFAALTRAYDRMADRGEVPPFGYSYEKIGFLISLDEDGTPLSVIDLRDGEGRKKRARLMAAPQPVKRTSGVAPNFLWDKTSYVLGITAGEGKRLAEEHAAFVARHEKALKDTNDPGLLALRRFLESWTPEAFEQLGWPDDMKDENIAFTLESDRLQTIRLHDRSAARILWARLQSGGRGGEAICLVSGERAPIARLHPAIKGIWGGQSSGGSIVSFNLDAFASYGHAQGDNAPVSEAAAFAYTTVLNKFLEKDSKNRIQIGDASTVFWADGSKASLAEGIMSVLFEGTKDEIEEGSEAAKIGAILQKLRDGQRLADFDPGLARGVRFRNFWQTEKSNPCRNAIRTRRFGAIFWKRQRSANAKTYPPILQATGCAPSFPARIIL